MSLYALAIPTYLQMLRSLSVNLDKGVAFAEARGFEPAVLLGSRLAPDMLPLAAQVKIACKQAWDAGARLTGRDILVLDHGESGFDQLKSLIAETVEFLEATPPAAFDAAQDRQVVLEPAPGLVFEMTGLQFVRDWSLPNFYFHVSTAYGVLRHNGVPLGKGDFISHVGAYMRPRGA